MPTYTIFTDGGSRGNPGQAALGVAIYFQEANEEAVEVYGQGTAIGIATNNEAEYLAFLHSLDWLTTQKLPTVVTVDWKLDSMLVVEQLNKRWKVKDARMQTYAAQAWAKIQQLQQANGLQYSICYVPRAQNKRADALVNQALDQL